MKNLGQYEKIYPLHRDLSSEENKARNEIYEAVKRHAGTVWMKQTGVKNNTNIQENPVYENVKQDIKSLTTKRSTST